MENVYTVVLIYDMNEFLELLGLNVFDQPLLGFCHTLSNLKTKPVSLKNGS